MENNAVITQKINAIYAAESRRVLATLIRLLQDFDLAEEALHDAFAIALSRWPTEGIPKNPRAWLVSAGRFKAIDHLRRRAFFNDSLNAIASHIESDMQANDIDMDDTIGDDQLKLIFTCCHPALAQETQVALTLREMCGLTTEEIARAFLVAPSTIAQRIVRAKNKIREAGIPYEIPAQQQLPIRLHAVLQVVYLLFNEGYSASSGSEVTSATLTGEAVRLGKVLVELLPVAECLGLLGLMLVHDARRAARTNKFGDLITLEHQDRALWDHAQIAYASQLIQGALTMNAYGEFSLQAAIAAIHAESPTYAATNWNEIIGLYDVLMRVKPSSVVALNRAVAISMVNGPEVGLNLALAIAKDGELQGYYLWHAACADFYQQLGQHEAAKQSYSYALALTQQEPERRYLRAKLASLEQR